MEDTTNEQAFPVNDDSDQKEAIKQLRRELLVAKQQIEAIQQDKTLQYQIDELRKKIPVDDGHRNVDKFVPFVFPAESTGASGSGCTWKPLTIIGGVVQDFPAAPKCDSFVGAGAQTEAYTLDGSAAPASGTKFALIRMKDYGTYRYVIVPGVGPYLPLAGGTMDNGAIIDNINWLGFSPDGSIGDVFVIQSSLMGTPAIYGGAYFAVLITGGGYGGFGIDGALKEIVVDSGMYFIGHRPTGTGAPPVGTPSGADWVDTTGGLNYVRVAP